MTEDDRFDQTFRGQARGAKHPGDDPPSPSPWAELAAPELLERAPELLERARELVDVLTANSRPLPGETEPTHIPSDEIRGELAVDDFGMPGDFCAARYGLLAEDCEVTDLLPVSGERGKPEHAFKLYELYESGFVGLLVKYAPTGEWTLLVPDRPE
jgi:hypothetical protein